MSYRQRDFWLRDNGSFEDGEEELEFYKEHYKKDNRSIWCELEKREREQESLSVPVRTLRFTNYSSEETPEWYPYESPYGGMLLLQIKRVL